MVAPLPLQGVVVGALVQAAAMLGPPRPGKEARKKRASVKRYPQFNNVKKGFSIADFVVLKKN